MNVIPEISPQELKNELESESAPLLLDVREANELEISRLDLDFHIPVAELMIRYRELDPAKDYVVICRVGQRSRWATQFLLEKGFRSVRNLETGMNGWALTVDPLMDTY